VAVDVVNDEDDSATEAAIYFFPEGWVFPGKEILTSRVPLRIEFGSPVFSFLYVIYPLPPINFQKRSRC
jgi:hypothetical protein